MVLHGFINDTSIHYSLPFIHVPHYHHILLQCIYTQLVPIGNTVCVCPCLIPNYKSGVSYVGDYYPRHAWAATGIVRWFVTRGARGPPQV